MPLTLLQFADSLHEGRYTSLGCYPKFLVMRDGGALCMKCVKEERDLIVQSHIDKGASGWEPETFDVNWEDASLWCDNCGQRIESAYAEDEATT